MRDHGVGRRHQAQRLAVMAPLSARLSSASLTQVLRLPLEPVAGGPLGAVVAMLGQPCFQLMPPCFARCERLADLLRLYPVILLSTHLPLSPRALTLV
jgi:hypothetical protein